jgi:hypothetical protein
MIQSGGIDPGRRIHQVDLIRFDASLMILQKGVGMEFVDLPVERTTALTDALLAAEAGALMISVHRFFPIDRWKVRLWQITLALLGVSACLGAIIHGVVLPPTTRAILWKPLNLASATLVACLLTAAIYDAYGSSAAKRALPVLIMVIAGIFGLTLLKPGMFLIVMLYAIAASLTALVIYGFLAWRRTLPGAARITLGIALSILASAIQASGRSMVPVIWTFDHNGMFHVVMIVAVAILMTGSTHSLRLQGRASAGASDVSPNHSLNTHDAD